MKSLYLTLCLIGGECESIKISDHYRASASIHCNLFRDVLRQYVVAPAGYTVKLECK